MKRDTVRWYAVCADVPPKYMGWSYGNKVSYREVRGWLRSGNYIKFKNETLNQFTSASKLLNLFPR